MRTYSTPLLLATALLLNGCDRPQPIADDAAASPPATAPTDSSTAVSTDTPTTAPVGAQAELKPTQGSTVSGHVRFARVDGALRVSGQISGLKPGSEHGFHIHDKGDCSAPDGSSAGGHFNPAQSAHGSIAADPHHGGDMPNLVADGNGRASVDGPLSSNVNLGNGDGFDIAGHALIVHADPDDYTTQPTGNAGARLACGVITASR